MMHYAPMNSKCLLHHGSNYEPRMTEAATRLKEAREKEGYSSAKAAAEAMGLAVATYIQHENGSRGYPATKAQKYARFFRTTPEWLLYGTKKGDTVIPVDGPTLYIVGNVAAGVWVEAWEIQPEDRTAFMGRPDVSAPADQRFGVMVAGESMNLIYPPGTILECVSAMANVTIASGKRVIVQRRRVSGEHEVTVKEYFVDDQGVEWLIPRSTHPAYQAPFRVDAPGDDITDIQIIGIVVASTRLE